MDAFREFKILTGLQRRLNGKCSDHVSTCPNVICGEWHCRHCVALFWPLCDLLGEHQKHKDAYVRVGFYPCPCVVVPDIALARLDERVNELKDQLGV